MFKAQLCCQTQMWGQLLSPEARWTHVNLGREVSVHGKRMGTKRVSAPTLDVLLIKQALFLSFGQTDRQTDMFDSPAPLVGSTISTRRNRGPSAELLSNLELPAGKITRWALCFSPFLPG